MAPFMRALTLDPHRLATWGQALAAALRAGLRDASHRTGLPVIVLAAAAMVVSWHLFRRTLRLVVEMALVSALLFLATRLGWVCW